MTGSAGGFTYDPAQFNQFISDINALSALVQKRISDFSAQHGGALDVGQLELGSGFASGTDLADEYDICRTQALANLNTFVNALDTLSKGATTISQKYAAAASADSGNVQTVDNKQMIDGVLVPFVN